MKKNNKNLHLVTDEKEEQNLDKTQAIAAEILEEIQDMPDPLSEIEERVRRHRMKVRIRVVVVLILIVSAVIGGYLYLTRTSYGGFKVVNQYQGKEFADSSYVKFGDGLLKYSKDGVARLNKKGEESWNQAYQISNPVILQSEESAAIADIGGNTIMVFEQTGLKGEIHTTLPIERAAISTKGIVTAILKDDTTPKIMCYDAVGNVLAEQKIRFNNSGYPVGISMSDDGKLLLVSYVEVKDGQTAAKLAYYDFSGDGDGNDNYLTTTAEYVDEIMPETFFIGNETSVAVGTSHVVIYSGKQAPKVKSEIKIDKKIKSTFHSDRYIGLVLKNEGESGYEVRLYNTNGKRVLSTNIDGEYSNVTMAENQIVLYDNNTCCIVNMAGIKRYEGETTESIQEMFPVWGINKYLMINANGIQEVRLTK